jgi:hypothetical protein
LTELDTARDGFRYIGHLVNMYQFSSVVSFTKGLCSSSAIAACCLNRFIWWTLRNCVCLLFGLGLFLADTVRSGSAFRTGGCGECSRVAAVKALKDNGG